MRIRKNGFACINTWSWVSEGDNSVMLWSFRTLLRKKCEFCDIFSNYGPESYILLCIYIIYTFIYIYVKTIYSHSHFVHGNITFHDVYFLQATCGSSFSRCDAIVIIIHIIFLLVHGFFFFIAYFSIYKVCIRRNGKNDLVRMKNTSHECYMNREMNEI